MKTAPVMEVMEHKLHRDESTPDRKEIWEFVEHAAARSGDGPDPGPGTNTGPDTDTVICPHCRTTLIRARIGSRVGAYHFTCVCGVKNVTANLTGKCWDCGRAFGLDWGRELER
jgi:hypothetical protein